MLATINLPPGLYNNGTVMQSAGRWHAANLMRWHEGRLRPIGGWRKRISGQTALTGACRAILPWKENGGSRWIALGTHSHLYVMNAAGTVTDITPSGFTAGTANATVKRGYGMGNYGTGLYGVPRPDTGSLSEASTWSLDAWGENLVGCLAADGGVYEWDLDTGNDAAAVSNAPTDAEVLVVTPERILVVGHGRTLEWSDQEDNTTWTPAATNQAGDFDLPTSGAIQQLLKQQAGFLALTTTDAWQASYLDPTYVYGFQRVGEGCGAISRKAAVSTDQNAVWMGEGGFYLFDGYVQPLQCDVADYVFSSLNTAQKSKVTAVHNAGFSEVWWFYPSSDSTENNRAVVYNYREGHWTTHTLTRTCGAAPGVFSTPLMVDADGYIYEHEVGVSRGGALPYAETGPIKPGEALPIPGWSPDYMMEVQRIVPDEDVPATYYTWFYAKNLPCSAVEHEYGPYSPANGSADVLFQAGQFRLRLAARYDTSGDVGPPRLDIIQGDPIPYGEDNPVAEIIVPDYSGQLLAETQ